jgi:probable rRNA maturation factor
MAFPMDELVDESRRPDAPEIGPALLGDVVLCPAFAAAQARKAGHGLADELALLTVHGVLHLLGYDHAEPEQEREMFSLQNALLAEWQAARHEAATREAQRRHDSRVLGTVGLEDS